MDERAARILDGAADALERDGWTRGHFSTFGRRCVIGALNYSARQELGLSPKSRGKALIETQDTVLPLIYDLLPDEYRCTYPCDRNVFINWNDDSSRTKQEVLDLLRKGAKRALGVEP